MEPSISMPIEPAVKEDLGLTASASSSYRLSYLSSSSRRVRRISPTLVSSYIVQKKGSETHSNSPPQSSEPRLLKFFRSPSLLISNDEPHRASQRPASTRMHKLMRGIFLIWSWFCIGYFSLSIFGTLKSLKPGWRDQRSAVAQSNMHQDFLNTLPLDHRLSKLSSLYAVPGSLHPFVLGPRRHDQNPPAACLWTDDSGLSRIQTWASSWQGPISLLVTYSDIQSYNHTLSRIAAISQTAPNVSFHTLHTPSSLRNFNAYINLARLFAPSSSVLLFPPHSLASWAPLPHASSAFLNTVHTQGGEFIIPMLPTTVPNASIAAMSRDVPLSSSALLFHRNSSPWCTERLFTISEEMTRLSENAPLASDTEMACHWQECVWNAWLRSNGKMQMLRDDGWALAEAEQTPLRLEFDSLPQTVETTLRVRLARRQRSETCVLVARELIALGHWFERAPTPPPPDSLFPPAGGDEAEQAEQVMSAGEMKTKEFPIESSQAKWLRGICRETLERWGKELVMD